MGETTLKLDRVTMSDIWLIFIRTTVFLAWTAGVWAFKMLLEMDKNQALLAQNMSSITLRLESIERKWDERDKEERMKNWRVK